MNTVIRKALEDARHALVTLHGLYAFDHPAPFGDQAIQIDEAQTIAAIDHALKESA